MISLPFIRQMGALAIKDTHELILLGAQEIEATSQFAEPMTQGNGCRAKILLPTSRRRGVDERRRRTMAIEWKRFFRGARSFSHRQPSPKGPKMAALDFLQNLGLLA